MMDAVRHRHYLKALGIPVWIPKAAKFTESNAIIHSAELLQALPAIQPSEAPKVTAKAPPMSPYEQWLKELANAETKTTPPSAKPKALQTLLPVADALDCSTMDWHTLQEHVQQCQRCGLAKTRTHTVFGVGNQQADWLIVGEAPGAEEDRRGEPFVGRAGQLLNNMLAAIGLPRQAAYILNMVKCRPPNNRDPLPEELRQCHGYLVRQISLIQPKLILVVGRVAAQNLLQTTLPLARLRSRVHHLPAFNTPVIVTYHPAYLLRKPIDKRKVWQDLQMAQSVAQQTLLTT